jgi:hypothetical protein
MSDQPHVCPAESLMAQLGRLDTRPETIAAMQRGLDAAWLVVDRAAEDWP